MAVLRVPKSVNIFLSTQDNLESTCIPHNNPCRIPHSIKSNGNPLRSLHGVDFSDMDILDAEKKIGYTSLIDSGTALGTQDTD